jgi:hypothetical protein
LLVGAAISVLTMYPFSAAVDRVQLLLIGLSAALISAGLVVALLLDYPFAGSIAVSSEPFGRGALATSADRASDQSGMLTGTRLSCSSRTYCLMAVAR